MTKFYTQVQMPSGDWIDSIGSDNLDSCARYMIYCQDKGKIVRVVSRTDTIVNIPGSFVEYENLETN